MIALAWRLLRAGGVARAVLVACCTALVTTLLLLVVDDALLPTTATEWLMTILADPSERLGTAVGTTLLALPPLLLLYQSVHFGTTARERRLAALRLAGATPAQVRLVGAVEVGIPSSGGAVAGLLLFWLLRSVAGGTPMPSMAGRSSWIVPRTAMHPHLVPTEVAPPWWGYLAVVAGTAMLGVAVGLLATRGVVATPLGVVRRVRRSRPTPWPLLLIALGGVLAVVLAAHENDAGYDTVQSDGDLILVVAALLVVVGLTASSPWIAWTAGHLASRRVRSAPALLGARRLAEDPRPAGRAGAAIGAIGSVCGGVVATYLDFRSLSRGGPYGDVRAYAIGPLELICLAVLAALVVVVGSLAVHSVEELLERRRSVAALVALGIPEDVVSRSQRWELALVALPAAVVGALLGAGGMLLLAEGEAAMVPALVIVPVLAALLVLLAVWAAVALVRPMARRVARPDHLRVE